PITKEPFSRDPRNIAQKAEKYLKSTGIADTAYFGPEAEFFIFDEVRYDSTNNQAFYLIDSVEGQWNSGKEEEGGNRGYKPRYKEGYFPVAPTDSLQDIRTEMCRVMPTSESRWSVSTMKWRPRARRRSTSASTHCAGRPTT